MEQDKGRNGPLFPSLTKEAPVLDFELRHVDPNSGDYLPTPAKELAAADNLTWTAHFLYNDDVVGTVVSTAEEVSDGPLPARRIRFSADSDNEPVTALVAPEHPVGHFEDLIGELVAEHLNTPFTPFERAILLAQRSRVLNRVCFDIEQGQSDIRLTDDVPAFAIAGNVVQGATMDAYITSVGWDTRDDFVDATWAAKHAWEELAAQLDDWELSSAELFHCFMANELPTLLAFRHAVDSTDAPSIPLMLEEFPLGTTLEFVEGDLLDNGETDDGVEFSEFGSAPFAIQDDDGGCIAVDGAASQAFTVTAYTPHGDPLAVVQSTARETPRGHAWQSIRFEWPVDDSLQCIVARYRTRAGGHELESLIRSTLELMHMYRLSLEEELAFQRAQMDIFAEFLDENEELFSERDSADYERVARIISLAVEERGTAAVKHGVGLDAAGQELREYTEEAWLEVWQELLHTDINARTAGEAFELWQDLELYAHVSFHHALIMLRNDE